MTHAASPAKLTTALPVGLWVLLFVLWVWIPVSELGAFGSRVQLEEANPALRSDQEFQAAMKLMLWLSVGRVIAALSLGRIIWNRTPDSYRTLIAGLWLIGPGYVVLALLVAEGDAALLVPLVTKCLVAIGWTAYLLSSSKARAALNAPTRPRPQAISAAAVRPMGSEIYPPDSDAIEGAQSAPGERELLIAADEALHYPTPPASTFQSHAIGPLTLVDRSALVSDLETTHAPLWIVALAQQAEAGDAESQYRLANLYLEGRGLAWDDFKGLLWLRAAVRQSHPKACCQLGQFYLDGDHVGRDVERGLHLLSVGRNVGSPS